MIYEESLETLDSGAQVLAAFQDGSPALIADRHGRGATLYAGSYLSLAYERSRDANLEQFFQGLLSWAGIQRPASASSAEIEVRSLEGPGYVLYFVFNDGEKELPAEISLRTPFPAAAVRDIVADQAVPARQDGNRLTLKKSLAPEEVWVLQIQERR